jgi:hypothetical protein
MPWTDYNLSICDHAGKDKHPLQDLLFLLASFCHFPDCVYGNSPDNGIRNQLRPNSSGSGKRPPRRLT